MHISPETLQAEIERAIPSLLKMARELAWNDISDNCFFIISEIHNGRSANFFEEAKLIKRENDKKLPKPIDDIMLELLDLYSNLYDINLHIYRAQKHKTIIDIRYYPKSSLDDEYRQTVLENAPMLHCKVGIPPWRTNKKEKYDINWERRIYCQRWRRFWMGVKTIFLGRQYIIKKYC